MGPSFGQRAGTWPESRSARRRPRLERGLPNKELVEPEIREYSRWQACKRGGSREIVHAGFWILDIQRHGQVALLQEPVAEALHVRGLKRQTAGKFAGHGKIERL